MFKILLQLLKTYSKLRRLNLFLKSLKEDACESDVYEINHMNCGNEIKWRLILAVMNAIICNYVKKPEKNSGLQRGLNPWPRDTGATLYQLSYEATDVGSRSIVGSYVPWKWRMKVMYMKWIIYESFPQFIWLYITFILHFHGNIWTYNWPGARFSKLPVITGPVKQFCFPFQMGVLKVLKIIQ